MSQALLSVNGLTKRFGGLLAVDTVNFEVQPKSIVSVIGPNGAGKTTVFNLITGIYTPDAGTVLLNGVNLVGFRPDQVAFAGLARTFQNIRLFPGMTVLENVMVAQSLRLKTGYWHALAKTKAFLRDDMGCAQRAMELLDFVGLQHKASQTASSLPYGEQRRLEVARALATQPKLLLLDEPSAGMNPQETEGTKRLIQSIRNDLGMAVVLIEHDMRLVMTVSDQITVLDHGTKIAEGNAAHIRQHPAVVEAYLGRGVAAGNAGLEKAQVA
jgi:branched-chain amino acid transport system ATP-binding protein